MLYLDMPDVERETIGARGLERARVEVQVRAEHDRHDRHFGAITGSKTGSTNDGRNDETYPLIQNEIRIFKTLDRCRIFIRDTIYMVF